MMVILVSTEVNSSDTFDKILDQLIKINKNIATIHNDLKAIQFFHGRSKENADKPKNETNGIFILFLMHGVCEKFYKHLYLVIRFIK